MEENLALMDQQNQLAEVINLDDLKEEQRLKVAASILGYSQLPPTIEEFLFSGYYLSKETTEGLFPYWVDVMKKIYPNPIEVRYPILVLTGCIGSGKSTFSKLCALYTLCKLDHLKNPRKSLGIMPGKKLVMVLNHKSIDLAKKEFLDPLHEWMEASPYFNGGMIHGSIEELGVEFKLDRSVGMTPSYIGTDVVFGNLSEINFVNPVIAKNRIDTIIKRLHSRFQMYIDYFCTIVLDSSAQGDSSVVDQFMEDNPFLDKTLTLRMSRWEVRKHLNYFGTKGWFKVYCGDSQHAPFIVKDPAQLTPDLDPDRLIDVPEECRPEFETNLITALQDIAGISTSASGLFFSDPSIISKVVKIPQAHEDMLRVDFNDLKDDIMYYVQKAVDLIPKERKIYLRFDLGVEFAHQCEMLEYLVRSFVRG